MRATVEVYENNAGGIFVAVFGQNGLKSCLLLESPIMAMIGWNLPKHSTKRHSMGVLVWMRMTTTQQISLGYPWTMLMMISAVAAT